MPGKTGLASMTGFGEAHADIDTLRITVEARSINNRHLKLSLRAGDGYGVLERNIDALLRDRVKRGAVQVSLRIDRAASADAWRINTDVLQGYRRQLHELSPEAAATPLDALLSLPGVIDDARRDDTEPLERWPQIEPIVSQALDALAEMRLEEGKALAADLTDNCRRIADELTGIEARAPMVADAYRGRLHERVNKALAELNVTLEPADLAREVAVFADRSDISEETVRLRSHLEQFAAAVDGVEGGRKLEFITQEMGREVNTIGSKANDSEISARVVAIKTALERIREQVQNVE